MFNAEQPCPHLHHDKASPTRKGNQTYRPFIKGMIDINMGMISLVILTSRFEATRGLGWNALVILNRIQLTSMKPELPSFSPIFRTTPRGRLTSYVRSNAQQAQYTANLQ
ncbi:hypothetical protein AVEN_132928-1 [Araneus ventricosus]|uniref:Uncharacterized protein n=1 Tax=Araneus ventricosus TaxID=182803 RepID=A0A4Y2WVV5_ARAVE|nr:hypothetical protein AVEN_132928-1 [Araneus ventricosus]